MLKKIISVFAGILFSFVVLELSLQTAGLLISKYRELKNNAALKNKSEYTVMCLGESTTFGEYPESLREMLNKKYPDKFTVIDCGVPGIHLENMLETLDSNIAKYKPDFAVCMIGINDGFVSASYRDGRYAENDKREYFKLHKLYKLIKKHLSSLLKIKEAYADNLSRFDMEYAYDLFIQKKYADAAQACKEILEISPDDYYICDFLAMLYYYYLDKKDVAYKISLDIIEKNENVPALIRQNAYETALAYNLYIKENIEFARQLAGQVTNIDDIFITASLYWFIKDIITPEQKIKVLKKISLSKENIDQYYGIIAIESMDQKDYEKAEEYFRTAEELRLKYPNEKTYGLYKLIIKKLTDNNVKVICMQYPVRSIESLKSILKHEDCYNQIIFLSNEKNFKNLLKAEKYSEIFIDQFAGDFGHYKEEGKKLIAGNVLRTLEKFANYK